MPVWLRSSRFVSVFTLFSVLALPASTACAAPATYHVKGTVSNTSFPDYHVLPGVDSGDTISGVFTYDPAADSLQSSPSAFDFNVGQLRFRSGPAGIRVMSGLTTGPSGSSFALQNGGLGSTVSSDSRLLDVFTLLQLQDGSGTLNLAGLADGRMGPAESFRIDGAVALTPVTDLAPEPSSLSLLVTGFAALGLLRRKRHNPQLDGIDP